MRVLEFGCGTGTTAVHHAPHVSHIDAVDISEKMLALGRQKATAAGLHNLSFTRGTLAEFKADTGSLDVVLGLNVIHLLADREAVFHEVARILKPGGLFVSSTVCLGHTALRFLKFLVPLGKKIGLMPDLFILTERQLAAEVTNAGFSIFRKWHHGKNGIAVFMMARKE
ncbi:MAG: class I SAM-dependent methyltransferase [Myxococcota bacterium]